MAGTVITALSDSPFTLGDEVYARTNYYRTGTAKEDSTGFTGNLPSDRSGLPGPNRRLF